MYIYIIHAALFTHFSLIRIKEWFVACPSRKTERGLPSPQVLQRPPNLKRAFAHLRVYGSVFECILADMMK